MTFCGYTYLITSVALPEGKYPHAYSSAFGEIQWSDDWLWFPYLPHDEMGMPIPLDKLKLALIQALKRDTDIDTEQSLYWYLLPNI
jgi:hypothetical protein